MKDKQLIITCVSKLYIVCFLCFIFAVCSLSGLGLTGCAGLVPNPSLQITFSKNGLVVTGEWEKTPQTVKLCEDGVPVSAFWQKFGEHSIVCTEQWQPGHNYSVSIEGQQVSALAPNQPSPFVSKVTELAKLEELPSIKGWSQGVYEDTAVSADGCYIAVASFDQNVYLYNQNGEKIWTYHIPNGTGLAVAFAGDGTRVLVGEASSDGNLYALDIVSGKIVWQYAFGPELGEVMAGGWNNKPKVRSIAVTGNTVIAAGEYVQKVVTYEDGQAKVSNVTKSVVRSFAADSGKQNWQYPEKGTMDTGVSRIAVSADASKVVFVNSSYSGGREYLDGGIRLLAGITGQLIAFHQLVPIGGYFRFLGIYDGIDLSANGRYLAVVTADNRGMLFDLAELDNNDDKGITAKVKQEELSKPVSMQPLWLQQLSQPQVAGGVPIYAYGHAARVINNGQTIFSTSGTYSSDKTLTTEGPPFAHPDEASLYIYQRSGELAWIWRSEGGSGKLRLSADNRFLLMNYYHNYVTRQKIRAGLYCFDLEKKGSEHLLWFYPVEGVTVTAALADDGTTIAGVETPIKMEDDRPEGVHRLHILR